MTKEDLINMYNATSTTGENGEIESYESWLENQLIKREQIPAFDMHGVSQQRELLLSAICQFTKRNTQKEIQEVEKWIETGFRK